MGKLIHCCGVGFGPFKQGVLLEEVIERAYNVCVSRDEHLMISEDP